MNYARLFVIRAGRRILVSEIRIERGETAILEVEEGWGC